MSEYIIDMSTSSYQSSSGLLSADVSQLREEVVRCRDCRYLIEPIWLGEKQTFCSYMGDTRVEYDGFCKWGELK